MSRTILSLLPTSDREPMALAIDTIEWLQDVKSSHERLGRLCNGCIAVLWGEVEMLMRGSA